VASPNFRHPVPLARDVLALDDVSGGRLDLGVGPGSAGPDATALGQPAWSATERMDRFEEFLHILRAVLDGDAGARTTITGRHYAATDTPSTPGALQAPIPLTIAAGGPRGLRLVVELGQQWVTIGPTSGEPRTPDSILGAVRHQCALLDAACAAYGRDPATLGKLLLWGPTETILTSPDQFDDLAAPYEELGFDEFVLHHPAQSGPYSGSVPVFEQIAARHSAAGGR
jgi:alkanesulfonate monooxygenase SsuD/methylene tetrahydromethanopterin reductase-like flavin-dependent oxidoreductase (luciferase family)